MCAVVVGWTAAVGRAATCPRLLTRKHRRPAGSRLRESAHRETSGDLPFRVPEPARQRQGRRYDAGTRVTEYLTIILQSCRSYSRLMTDVVFAKRVAKGARLFLGTVHWQNHKIIWDSVRVLTYDIPKRCLSTLYFKIVSGPYDKLKIILC